MEIGDQNPTVTVMDVVVSTGSQEVTLVSTLTFKDKIEKILDIIANIFNIGYHIVGNKIIVQGMLHKQIFYMNNHGKTKFETEQLPFATFIELDDVKQHHHIRIEGRVEQMQRQLCLQGIQLKQKTTLIFEGTALEPRRYVMYSNQGYRYRIREVVSRKECRIQEKKLTVCDVPVQEIRSIDVQINNIYGYTQLNKVVVQGVVTRRLEFATNLQNRYLEEEFPFHYSFDISGVKPDMYVIIYGENDGKLVQFTSPTVKKDGTTIDHDINLCFCIYVCRYKQVSLLHEEGPIMLLQRPVGEDIFLRTLEHEIELLPDIVSLTSAEGHFFELQQELITDKMLVKGKVEYKIQYLSSALQQHDTTCVRSFLIPLDFMGANAKNLGEVKILPLPIETEITEQKTIMLRYKIQLIGQVFEEILMPVAAQQVQLI